LLACHRLSKTPRSLASVRFESNPEWERVHRRFHQQLIGGCGSKWLIAYCEQQAGLLYRYRQLSVRKIYPKRNIKDEHETITKAAIAGDADRAVALLIAHYQSTADIILADPEFFSAAGRE
jgi:DNA-binding GntR family transcriptional regulator